MWQAADGSRRARSDHALMQFVDRRDAGHKLRARGAARIVVAVPVGARESVALVSKDADAVVCPIIP
jgi:predicted phosphoribosyltransferase